MKNIRRYTFTTCLLLFLTVGAMAQDAPGELSCFKARFLLQFPLNRADIDPDYKDNYYAIQELKRFFHTVDLAEVDSVLIVGSASPDGSPTSNKQLARLRAEALQSFVETRFDIDSYKLQLQVKGDTWPDMLSLIRRDDNFPNKNHTLVVLENNIPYADRLKTIRFMEYREAYEVIKRDIFPSLRNAMAVAIYYKDDKSFEVYDSRKAYTLHNSFIAPTDQAPQLSQPTTASRTDSIAVASMSTLQPTSVILDDSGAVATMPTFRPKPLTFKQPLFALKTNMLFDVASLLNLELEVPIGKHFSIAAEVVAPWWLWENKQHCLQMMSGNIEGRYWFGNRDVMRDGTLRPVMTGWFAGIYVGGGYYDLEWDRTGYQGEFFIAAGVSGGFAHTINRSGTLRMEYSLGVGYMQTNYRKYEAKIASDNEWHLYRRESGVFQWFGPTRLKVSLVWMLNSNKRGGLR